MNFLPINVAAGANRTLVRSALPDAPVVEDEPRRRPVRTAFRTALRAVRTAFAGAPDRDHRADAQPASGPSRPAARHTARKPAESC